MPSPKQVAAARALLGWSQTELCEHSGLSYTAVNSYESENGNPTERTRQAIEKAFSPYVDFLGETGVQLKSPDVRIYKGRGGFIEFIRSVYETVKDNGGEVLVSNVDERKFEEWLGDKEDQDHMERMGKVENLNFKALTQQGDYHLTASNYIDYRWSPKFSYQNTPIYLHGDKIGFVTFKDEPTVYVLSVPEITDAFRSQFYALWAIAEEIKQ